MLSKKMELNILFNVLCQLQIILLVAVIKKVFNRTPHHFQFGRKSCFAQT